jgi:hypothetical protein
MDKRESSGIHDMKDSYRYQITKNKSVIEYINDISYFIWDIKLLRNNNKEKFKTDSKSFNRTKDWLQKNHPELLI